MPMSLRRFVGQDKLRLILLDLDLGGGGEDMRPPGGDRGVAVDELGHGSAEGTNTERTWSSVEDNDAGGVSVEDATGDKWRRVRLMQSP